MNRFPVFYCEQNFRTTAYKEKSKQNFSPTTYKGKSAYIQCLHGLVYESEVKLKVAQSCPTLCNPMDCIVNSPGQNTGVGSLSLLQGIFLTQGLNPVSHIACRFFTNPELSRKPLACEEQIKDKR